MTHASIDATKDRLVEDFNAVISDTEQLLKSVAAGGGEKATALRATIEQNLKAAKDRLQGLEEAATARARAAAKATDNYVHGHPWQSVGVAAGVAGIVGIVIGLLLNRR